MNVHDVAVLYSMEIKMSHIFTKFVKDPVRDPRDWKFSRISQPVANLPPSVDLRPGCPPVYDQGQLGSCSGNAIAGAIEFDKMKQKLPTIMPSRLFIYYNERVLEGTVNEDAGAMIRDGIRTICVNGVCDESVWPYDINTFTTKPSDAAYKEALNNKVIGYYGLDVSAYESKQALAQGYPIVVGIQVFEDLESEAVARSGNVPMPTENSKSVGGHAVMIVGYDDSRQCWIMRNSWGADWGDRGYFYLPYAYMNPDLMSDMWVVTVVQ